MRTLLIATAALAAAAIVPAFAQDAGTGSQSQTKMPTTAQQQHGQSGTPTVVSPNNTSGAATTSSTTDMNQATGNQGAVANGTNSQ